MTRLAFATQQNKTSLEQNEKCYAHSMFLEQGTPGLPARASDLVSDVWFDSTFAVLFTCYVVQSLRLHNIH